MKSEYLLFNVLIACCPFVVRVFFQKVSLPQRTSAFWSIILVAIIFCVWDIIATGIFWKFNPTYILGWRIAGVPVEEVMFFFSVPYACLFLWENLSVGRERIRYATQLTLFIIFVSMICGGIFILNNKYYTGIDLLVFGLVLALDWITKINVFFTRKGLLFGGLVVVLTFIFNLYLTVRPVVEYFHGMKTNINIITIPIEDFVYGLSLILFVVVFYEVFNRRMKIVT